MNVGVLYSTEQAEQKINACAVDRKKLIFKEVPHVYMNISKLINEKVFGKVFKIRSDLSC